MKPRALCLALLTAVAAAQSAVTYQKPPDAIERLLDAPVTPVVTLSPDRATLLIEQPADFPSIADVAEPRFRLAGLRFNPSTSGPSRELSVIDFKLQPAAGGDARPVIGLPVRLKASNATWSPNGKYVAFVQRTLANERATAAVGANHSSKAREAAAGGAGLELWLIDVATAHAHRAGTVRLNAVLGRPFAWMPDSATLLAKIIPADRGEAPRSSDVPAGPNVEENLGRVSPGRTYEDMLKTPADEAIFTFYATSQLALVPLTGTPRTLPVKGLLEAPSASPNGQFALIQELHPPFSYALPYEMYPEKAEVVTLKTGAVKLLSDRPLIDNLPIAFDAVEPGPRSYQWRGDTPATVVWVVAGDGGDPAVKAAVRDRVLALAAPFDGTPSTLLELPMRLAQRGIGGAARGLFWANPHLALALESRWSDRRTMMVAFDPSSPGKVTTLFEGSSQDRYKNPGRPVTETSPTGHELLRLTPDGKGIYFFAQGATPKGDQPFVATMPVGGGTETILERSADPFYAEPVALLSDAHVLIRRESQTEAPNYFAAPLIAAARPTQLTHFPSPYAGQQLPKKQLLQYKRADGVDLTATLWLPATYDKAQGPLPMVMEAYPAEFKTRAAAGQVAGSPNRFPRIGWGSPVFFAQNGYAVLENASIPIIGEGTAQPNDTYTEQLVAGAKAAIDSSAAMGVVDPKRVAVMGHSYGAFMTANLLAHSNLFRAGIARSGAYNRTLTPYGFQAEERTYWQAPDVYFKMSPFNFADKIKTPLLMIHGEADDNQGTFPVQSERFFAALKGQGATVRLVWLPLEAHGYEAHESLSHVLWEENRWLDTYVKPTTPLVAETP